MTVNQLLKDTYFKPLVLTDGDREINGVYIGDLLSWVMGRASASDAWITIMSNVNVLAVAALTDCACVILAEGVVPEESVTATAGEKGVNIISCDGTAFETAIRLNRLI